MSHHPLSQCCSSPPVVLFREGQMGQASQVPAPLHVPYSAPPGPPSSAAGSLGPLCPASRHPCLLESPPVVRHKGQGGRPCPRSPPPLCPRGPHPVPTEQMPVFIRDGFHSHWAAPAPWRVPLLVCQGAGAVHPVAVGGGQSGLGRQGQEGRETHGGGCEKSPDQQKTQTPSSSALWQMDRNKGEKQRRKVFLSTYSIAQWTSSY